MGVGVFDFVFGGFRLADLWCVFACCLLWFVDSVGVFLYFIVYVLFAFSLDLDIALLVVLFMFDCCIWVFCFSWCLLVACCLFFELRVVGLIVMW